MELSIAYFGPSHGLKASPYPVLELTKCQVHYTFYTALAFALIVLVIPVAPRGSRIDD